MPDATITSTASTFGTISGTFAADQSTVTGTVTGIVAGTLTGSVGVPGPQGPTGSTGATGATGPAGSPGSPGVGVPVGGTAGQFLTKIDGTNYNTDWTTVNLSAYAVKANNLSDLASASTARTNLGLGTMATETAADYLLKAGGTITGNIVSNNGSTFSTYDGVYKTISFNANNLQLNNAGPGGSALTVESDGITFATGKQTVHYPGAATLFTSPVLTGDPTAPTPATSDNDTSIATTAFVKAQGYLTSAPVTSVAGRTGAVTLSNTDISGLGSLAVVNDAPSDGSQYARKNGAWDVVSAGASYISSVSSPLSVTTGNLTIDLSAYLTSATAASNYQTLAGMSSYLTTATAASTYYLQTNPSGFQTAGDVTTALSPYLLSATAASTYAVIAAGQPVAGTTGQVLTKNSGTNYDSSWATPVVGDRYLTSSTTSNTLSNTTKTFTIGTGLSYTPTQNITISYDASNHMHGEVLTYNSGTGVLTVDINNHTGSGTYAAWVVNVGGVTPDTSVAWGAITGTLSSQTDLQSALDLKLAATTAAATYLPLSGGSMPSGSVITILDGGVQIYETVLQNKGLLIRDSASTPLARFQADEVLIPSVGITFSDLTVQTSAGISAATAASTYAPLASPALTGNVTITSSTGAALFIEQSGTGNILTLHDQASDTNFVAIDANGKVSTIASEATNGAGLNIAHGVAPTTPVNGDVWSTTSGLFMRVNGVTRQYVDFDGTQTINGAKTFSNASSTFGSSTATGTIGLASGATISGSTKTLNIGTSGVSGSTTLTTIGPVLGASTTSIGNTTAASTLNLATGATLTATTKAVNIGTSGVAGSTTNIAIGSTTGTSTTTLRGATNGITAAADTNSVALATTAFVVGQAGSATPLVNGTAAVGTSLRYARQDHVHGTDTTRAPLASPTFTGTPTAPTAAAATNTTQIATTAFVTAAVPTFATNTQARLGSSTTLGINPNNLQAAVMSPDWSPVYRFGFTATASGTGANVTLGYTNTFYQLPTTGAVSGHAYARTFGTSQVDQLTNLWGDDANIYVNFAKRIWISGRSLLNFPDEAVYTARVSFGKAEATGVGDLAARGIGWRYSGGSSNFVQLMVHNGTTLTTVNSSFHPTGVAFDWDIVSAGDGNVTLFVNGSQVATTSAGPSTRATSGQCLYQEEIGLTATSTGNFLRFYCARGAIYVQP